MQEEAALELKNSSKSRAPDSFVMHWRRCVGTLRKIKWLCLSQVLVYGLTLAVWPTLPGQATPHGIFARSEAVKAWWFDFVILSFNSADLLSRILPGVRYTAKHCSQFVIFLLACLRLVLLLPTLFPHVLGFRGEGQNWCILCGIFVLGLTNGFLSTISFIQAPSHVREGMSDMAAYAMVGSLYFGLGLGSTMAYVIDRAI